MTGYQYEVYQSDDMELFFRPLENGGYRMIGKDKKDTWYQDIRAEWFKHLVDDKEITFVRHGNEIDNDSLEFTERMFAIQEKCKETGLGMYEVLTLYRDKQA